jgi:hypothetical protein
VNQDESKRHQEARPRVIDIHFYAQRRSQIANDSLGNTEKTDGMPSPGVLQGADQSPGNHAGNGATARNGKKDSHQQRQIQYSQKADTQKNLEKDGQHRNANGNRPAKPMYFNFLARG